MTLQEFIDQNRGELVDGIRNVVGPNADVDDDEIEMWIANDEGLYNWALESGVDEEDI